jgi:hypothetical protein
MMAKVDDHLNLVCFLSFSGWESKATTFWNFEVLQFEACIEEVMDSQNHNIHYLKILKLSFGGVSRPFVIWM